MPGHTCSDVIVGPEFGELGAVQVRVPKGKGEDKSRSQVLTGKSGDVG